MKHKRSARRQNVRHLGDLLEDKLINQITLPLLLDELEQKGSQSVMDVGLPDDMVPPHLKTEKVNGRFVVLIHIRAIHVLQCRIPKLECS